MANILQCVVLVFLYTLCVQAILQKSHYGNQFYIGMIAARNWTTDFQIDIASKSNGNLYLDIPYLNLRRNETLQRGSTILTVNNSLIRAGTFTENRGIYLSTDVPVAVYVTWQAHPKVMDTYLALPLSSLGTRYIVASYDPCSLCKPDRSEMIIIGVHDNTMITVTDRYKRNTTLKLNALDAHQLSNTKDISNTAIVSDKQVTVISGTSCANIPHGVFQCDLLLEQMIPSFSWKKAFIVPPVFPKLGFLLKIFSENNAAACITNSSRTVCYHSNQEEYIMGTDPAIITSRDSISVVQYGVGERYDFIDADEFMTVIPGIENYLNSYYFVIPQNYSSLANRLSITVPSSNAGGLRMDGMSLAPDKTYSVPDPFSNYSVLIINITVGYHELTHTDTNVMFGATAYGFGAGIGYGFPVGFRYLSESHLTSSTTTSTLPTTSSTSPTTSSTPSTAAPTSTTLSASVSMATNGPVTNVTNVLCFSCDDLSHVELCNVVKHCSTNEVCYIESYEKFGRKLYRSGCLQSATCQKNVISYQSQSDMCAECCSQNYCNNKGCGDTGLSPRDQRGPMCYDCPHELSPQDCNKLTLCKANELCSIEEFGWGDHSQFKTGCASGQDRQRMISKLVIKMAEGIS
ncbi:uncharacterized protein LOC123561572 isoform X2 [Mercenaria mercenaria]|uniref:uncharacterized protein LOC123561572 isoform X2 n=1 Tax=Mercenaria mercenaria TaxID=6596 RepID=UPI00234F2D0B|nr:uncharacterized protein LOC123561572 isoform X2 [Mercenaria mercenaria]